MPDGRGGEKAYPCQANHELVISSASLQKYADRIGFVEPEKRDRLSRTLAAYVHALRTDKFTSAVVKVTEEPPEDVFDCTVEDVHAFDANGLFVQNCGEILLQSSQNCNLSEVYCRPHDTPTTLKRKHRLATMLGTFQSMLTHLPYCSPKWKENCEAERLLGVSLTGQWDCPTVQNAALLRELRDTSLLVNAYYAKRLGIAPSMAITCVKPNGNGSQTFDVSSGMHPRHAPFYLRRIRISAHDPLFHMLRDAGWPHHPENGTHADTTQTFVLDFPVQSPPSRIYKGSLTAVQQLEYWKLFKMHYTEHNPSVTISVAPTEWDTTAHWVHDNWDVIGGLSFLPRDDHTYALAPYETITEDEYHAAVARLPHIDFSAMHKYEQEDTGNGARELACTSGHCEL
jgi:hypothetical protein